MQRRCTSRGKPRSRLPPRLRRECDHPPGTAGQGARPCHPSSMLAWTRPASRRLACSRAAHVIHVPAPRVAPAPQAVWAQAQTVTPAGASLARLIDSLAVETRWLNDIHVAWFSGLPNNADATSGEPMCRVPCRCLPPSGWDPPQPPGQLQGPAPAACPPRPAGVATHCSAFVSAVCERLGVYVLRPPEHSQMLLANQQAMWVNGTGEGQGWSNVPDPVTAQVGARLLWPRALLVTTGGRSPAGSAGRPRLQRAPSRRHLLPTHLRPPAGAGQPRPAGPVPAEELRPLQGRPHRCRAPLCAGGRLGRVGAWMSSHLWASSRALPARLAAVAARAPPTPPLRSRAPPSPPAGQPRPGACAGPPHRAGFHRQLGLHRHRPQQEAGAGWLGGHRGKGVSRLRLQLIRLWPGTDVPPPPAHPLTHTSRTTFGRCSSAPRALHGCGTSGIPCPPPPPRAICWMPPLGAAWMPSNYSTKPAGHPPGAPRRRACPPPPAALSPAPLCWTRNGTV